MFFNSFTHPTKKLIAMNAERRLRIRGDYEQVTPCPDVLLCCNAVLLFSDNYILDVEETSVTINTSGYPTGLYSVILVADGDIQSSKNLVIQ